MRKVDSSFHHCQHFEKKERLLFMNLPEPESWCFWKSAEDSHHARSILYSIRKFRYPLLNKSHWGNLVKHEKQETFQPTPPNTSERKKHASVPWAFCSWSSKEPILDRRYPPPFGGFCRTSLCLLSIGKLLNGGKDRDCEKKHGFCWHVNLATVA